ncbi:hypothetical protein [Stenotrophomonas sp. 57]|uniref:hypothetical protein n=1 Tax=Stenotrophomonas sp. 57 TaxID=3051119 RepID=UPI00256EBE2C|nr:hypothetical protein [Stenotrophomonas sp. 57]
MNLKKAKSYLRACGFKLERTGSQYLLSMLPDRESTAIGVSLSREYQTFEELSNALSIAAMRASQYEACEQWVQSLIEEDRSDDHANVVEALDAGRRLPKALQDELDAKLIGLSPFPLAWTPRAKPLLLQKIRSQ